MDEELAAISAIYCGEEEVKILQKGCGLKNTIIQVQVACSIDSADAETVPVTMILVMNPDYPCQVPDVTIQCTHITRQQASQIKIDAIGYSNELIGCPMIMDIIVWLQHNFRRYHTSRTKNIEGNNSSEICTVLLHIDHMRAKAKYIKTLQKWTEEFGLTGMIIFCRTFIFVLLQGHMDCIKDYMSRLRTVNVDVDSKGRSCKERMMTVLGEVKLDPKQTRLQKFQIIETNELDQISDIFTSVDLRSLFDTYMIPFFKK